MSVQHKQNLFIYTTKSIRFCKINKIVVAQYCMLQELAIKSKFGVSITHVWCPNIEGISILLSFRLLLIHMDRVKRIWYLTPMRAAKVQASLRIRAVSPEPLLLAHTSSESRGTFRQKARSLASEWLGMRS